MSQPPPFVMRQVFSDPTPGGLINQRILHHALMLAREMTDMSEEEQLLFFRTLTYVGRKLAFTWLHVQAYQKTVGELRSRIEEAPPKPGLPSFESSEKLFQEFDEFAVQLKSTLDHLVKIGVPTLGKWWTLRTFGDKGRDVVKALENNAPKKYKAQVKGFKGYVMKTHQPWLETFIALRDRLNHYIDGSLPIEQFGVNRLPDGRVVVPMWNNEQELGDAMEAIWTNLFLFVEDFVAVFLFFRHRDGLTLFHAPDSLPLSNRSPWRLSTQDVMERAVAKGGWKDLAEA